MKKQKPKIIVIVGPTASGKSDLAVKLAKRFGGEIISADSRQVYRGLNIGTGKIPGRWSIVKSPTGRRSRGSRVIYRKPIFVYKNIPHHCIDFVSPKKVFTAAEFKDCADRAIRDITARGKIPIIAGGTGFYIDAVALGISLPRVKPNKKLRSALETKNCRELEVMLKKLDPYRAKNIDIQNPRRLIRAIEIAKAIGRVPKLIKHRPYRALWLGIDLGREVLRSKIRARLLMRIRRGMVKEAKRLRKSGLSWRRFYDLGLEYRYLADFLRGKITKSEMRDKLERAIWHYARRQMAWFRRNPEILWIKNKKEALRLAGKFLSDDG